MTRPGRIQFWPAAVVGLLGMNVVIVMITVAYATHDHSGAVEIDYYQKAVSWDATARKQLNSNRAIGWTLSAEPAGDSAVNVKVVDGAGVPLAGVKVEALCWHNAWPTERRQVSFDEVGSGTYRAAFPAARTGYWHLELSARKADRLVTATRDVFVGAPGK
jgi:nitrogen fixation protein FixH